MVYMYYERIALGGDITLSIAITAAGAFSASQTQIVVIDQTATHLEPLSAPRPIAFFAIGLFAAGMSRSGTGALGAEPDLASAPCRAIWR